MDETTRREKEREGGGEMPGELSGELESESEFPPIHPAIRSPAREHMCMHSGAIIPTDRSQFTSVIPAVRFGRVPKREKAKILAAMQSSRMKTQESKVLGEMNDDGKIIETIVRAHYDTCDYTRNKMEPFIQNAKTQPSYAVCSGMLA
ncbi:hypothetical protein TCAL_17183 [Tigriopus californicus]|uniref:Uncharacterized protein n=1 Tax=Tigriopus californicus TaxID=6832 RepID=A0A553N8E7_TIGCA|nr:hypothetical protein TCAL_17183 [Tigriopus californicus]